MVFTLVSPSSSAEVRFWKKKPALELGRTVVNDPSTRSEVRLGSRGAAVLRSEILLDRAHFSPGEIDGRYGTNLAKAIVAYQSAHGLPVSGVIGEEMWKSLNRDTADALTWYTITPEDVAGPWVKIPLGMMAKAKLERLGYSSPLEQFSERFHINPQLLTTLNRGKDFSKPGTDLVVPNLTDVSQAEKASSVVVDKSELALSVFGAGGRLLARYPATVGSRHDPLPIGTWTIKGVAREPVYHYNPRLFWDAESGDRKVKVLAGPNNPVGVVWIDLSKEHYGIHGTPEPSAIGKTSSHGCIRLTNWSAQELASMVAPGVKAILQE